MLNRGPIISYKPGAYYWREENRERIAARDVETLGEMVELLLQDNARLRAVIRESGTIPPKGPVLPREARDKPGLMA